jgi:redox-sensing transcriptional repressor
MKLSITTMLNRLIPEPTLRRLPRYHHLLQGWRENGVKVVSATHIGDALGLVPIQVRKDLQITGIIGRPKTGYDLNALISSIETFLGWNNTREAFLVGAGDLGSALLGYNRFGEFGLSIIAAFDSNPYKVDREIHGKPVFSIDRLCELTQRMEILIGVITTPAEAAQSVTDMLVKGGVRAIWNFAPTTLRVPPEVVVHNEDLYYSLAALSCKLSKALQSTGDRNHGSQQWAISERAEVRENLPDTRSAPETTSAAHSNTPGSSR